MPRAAAETNPLVILDGGSFDVAQAQRPVLHAMPPSAWSLQRIGQRLARRAKLGSGDAEHEEWEMHYQTNDEVSDGLTWSQVIAHTCAARSALLHLTRKGPSTPRLLRSRLATQLFVLRGRKARDAVKAGLIEEDTLVWSNSLDEESDWVPCNTVRALPSL